MLKGFGGGGGGLVAVRVDSQGRLRHKSEIKVYVRTNSLYVL